MYPLHHIQKCHSPFFKTKQGSPYSITERRVPEMIPVLGSQPAGDTNHKPDGTLPLLSTRPAVTPVTLNRAAINFAAWWTEAQWVWTVCLRLLTDSIVAAIWTHAYCTWVQHTNHSATEPPFLRLFDKKDAFWITRGTEQRNSILFVTKVSVILAWLDNYCCYHSSYTLCPQKTSTFLFFWITVKN